LFVIIAGVVDSSTSPDTTTTPTYVPTQAEKLQACISLAESEYLQAWDQTCKDNGLKKDCKLSSVIAGVIDQRYAMTKSDCYNSYPNK
jgi:hypothetical protein